MEIILDTNILLKDYKMSSKIYQAFLGFLVKTDSKIILPEVVVQEAIANYKKDLDSNIKKIEDLYLKTNNMLFEANIIENNIILSQEIKSYRSFLERPWKDIKVDIIGNSPLHLNETIKRIFNGIKPASASRQEYKDVLIWLCIKDYLEAKTTTSSVIFISNNFRDFGEKKGDNILAYQLQEELKKENLELIYYENIEDFLKSHASKVDFITKEWLKVKINKETMTEQIEDALLKDEYVVMQYLQHQYSVIRELNIETIMFDLGNNYFTVDLDKDNIFLHFNLDVTVEYSFLYENMNENVFYPDNESIEFSFVFTAKIENNEIIDIEIDDWVYWD